MLGSEGFPVARQLPHSRTRRKPSVVIRVGSANADAEGELTNMVRKSPILYGNL